MSEIIKTIEVERWSEPDEHNRVKHIGMITAQEAFEQLYTHLQAKGMVPDDYFILSDYRNENADKELPDFTTAICHVDFGGSEGIYLDILLEVNDGKRICFATGKTLDEDADAFFRMSRIAAECSLMLNGRGYEYVKNKEEVALTSEERESLRRLLEKICPIDDRYAVPETENEDEMEL